jgi:cytochrome c biogenesis protein CcmG/thiol:disulfide interchange protein DsbE
LRCEDFVKRSVIFVLFVVVAITALLLSGKYMSRKGSAKAAATSDVYGPLKGTMAPDFTLNVLAGNGKTIQLSSLRGKPVVVNFWATYCEPCKKEMPSLAELQKQYEPEGLQILGIVMDDPGEKTILDFAHRLGVNYPVLVGTDKVADTYGGVDGLPTTFYVDRTGKVVDRVLGGVSKAEIEESIKKALSQATTASAK